MLKRRRITRFCDLRDSDLKTFATRLSYLVHIGCRPYELVEYPKILLLSESEIDERVEKLRTASCVHGISIPLLKFATPELSDLVVNNNVLKYLQPLGGRMSRIEEIVQELNCSDTKMMEILTRNPRLLGNSTAEKIRCLISYGARCEDLYRNTNVLNNKTLATIRSHAERLSKIGWIPLPLGLLGRQDAAFEAVVGQQEAQCSLVAESQVASTNDVISLLPPMSANRIITIRPKINYLLSEGYTVFDIVYSQQALKLSLEKLKMTISELKPYHLQCVDLAVICHYAQKRRILLSRRCNLRSVIARVIGCSLSALPPLPTDSSFNFSTNIYHAAVVNAKYLGEELGFTAEDLASVPLVITHEPDIVRRHWNALENADSSQSELPSSDQLAKSLFRRHVDNRRLRLNLLQYCIEKEANFSHVRVSTWTEDSDDDFRVTASTAVAVVEDTSNPGDDESNEEGPHFHVTLNMVDASDYNDDDDDDDVDPVVV